MKLHTVLWQLFLRLLRWITTFFLYGPTWREDYNRFARGLGHRKIDPSDPTEWVNCLGTPGSILHEIKKYDICFDDLRRSLKKSALLEEACKNMVRQILMVSAEWRTFFDNQRLNPKFISDSEMQEVADLAYNHWRDFQLCIEELRDPVIRIQYESLEAISKFIGDERAAISKLINIYKKNNISFSE